MVRRQTGTSDLYPKDGPPARRHTCPAWWFPANLPDSIAVAHGVTKLNQNTLIDNQNYLAFSPRVGLAWRPFKNLHNTVFRAGYGCSGQRSQELTPSVYLRSNRSMLLSLPVVRTIRTLLYRILFQLFHPASAFPLYQPVKLGSNPDHVSL